MLTWIYCFMCPRLIATVTRHVRVGNNIEPTNTQLLISFIHTKYIVTCCRLLSIVFSTLSIFKLRWNYDICFSIRATICSRPFLSTSVNLLVIGASISNTPIIWLFLRSGTTISDLLFASQAM